MRSVVSRLTLTASLLLLSACENPFANKDWREVEETAEECVARLSGKLEVRQLLEAAEGQVVPTYAFDITKMELMAINEMIVPPSGNSRGSLRTSAFGATAPPVAAFMELSVTEDGAFYFGDDPSLYRVRGEAVLGDQVLASGCAMQKPGMRFISFKLQNSRGASAEGEDN